MASASATEASSQASLEALTFQLVPRVQDRIRRNRDARLVAFSELFDRDWYLGQYPDVRMAGVDPVLHYLEHGASEGRNPSPLFDSAWYDWYMQQNLVRNTGINPLVHYLRHGNAEWPSDVAYHLARFKLRHSRRPSKSGMLLNDFLFRMKIGPEISNALRVRVSDKEMVKAYVKERVGDQFNTATITVLSSFQDAMRFNYPHRCVIKPTHASGQVIFRRSGELIDFDRIDCWFDFNYYHFSRERNYRTLSPKLIVEPFVFDCDNAADYKVFCWKSEPRMIQVDVDRFGKHERAYYDTDWNRQPFTMNYPRHEAGVSRPEALELMLNLARKLSADFSFIRVDFYLNGQDVLVGELTNCPEGGHGVFDPRQGEEVASRLIFGSDYRAA